MKELAKVVAINVVVIVAANVVTNIAVDKLTKKYAS